MDRDEQAYEELLAMLRSGVVDECRAQGSELISRQIEAVIRVVARMMVGFTAELRTQFSDINNRLASLEWMSNS